ncbi:Gfo/Idh/MocA family protein [Spirilliplanes yamanashiensis]|uniref:Oxidoreductase n=1 Tax=Spirilliplanes yamanashiensis TaxID=42233 RepID=A0A8J4DLE4_9ACTN|nr:Gfo/Idh/MocA family oxidoreductase [Spirilliplanes yamanashiensis]MDP9818184.1 putative dehydrogenase [Spirilliplanes yamanashiensis]GIJ04995.1 oxidoreductase [Spirilliplanes yamanashiensis]
MRVGVVGCGYWGSKHLRVLQQTAGVGEVVAIDPRPERRAELATAANGVSAYARLRDALGHVDAVVIATPPRHHVGLAHQALCAGKHVMVEKPMTMTSAGARRLIQEAAERHLTLMVGHTFEHNAVVWKLREVIESGELGEIYYIDTARLNLGAYQSDVNVVWDLAPHDISIINYLLGGAPESVEAWGADHVRSHREDVAHLRLGYGDRGVQAQVHVSWLDPCKVRRVTVVGSRRMAVFDDLADQERLRIYDKGVVYEPHGPSRARLSYRYGAITAPFIEMTEPLGVQDQHFVECCLSGRRPRSDGQSGLAVVQVLEAADEALRHGTRVRVADGEPAPFRAATNGAQSTALLDLLARGA